MRWCSRLPAGPPRCGPAGAAERSSSQAEADYGSSRPASFTITALGISRRWATCGPPARAVRPQRWDLCPWRRPLKDRVSAFTGVFRTYLWQAAGSRVGLTQLIRGRPEDNMARPHADSSTSTPATIKMMPAMCRELAVRVSSKTEPAAMGGMPRPAPIARPRAAGWPRSMTPFTGVASVSCPLSGKGRRGVFLRPALTGPLRRCSREPAPPLLNRTSSSSPRS
jgi:hypothetical protein